MHSGQIKFNEIFKETDSAGFSLLEVVIAVSIFAVGILAVASMQIATIKSNTSATGNTRAIECASDRVERLMSLSYSDAALTANNYTLAQASDGIDNDNDGVIDENGETGNLSISYNVVNNASPANTKTITYNVKRMVNGVSQTVVSIVFTKVQNI